MLRMPRGSLAQRQLATGQLAHGDQVCDGDYCCVVLTCMGYRDVLPKMDTL